MKFKRGCLYVHEAFIDVAIIVGAVDLDCDEGVVVQAHWVLQRNPMRWLGSETLMIPREQVDKFTRRY
jgi:hypothetical protein